MRILVTGSRDWADDQALAYHLGQAAWDAVGHGRLTIIHGACPRGADAMADRWARHHGFPVETHPADWDHCADTCPPAHRVTKRPGDVDHPGEQPDYCPTAGPRRNQHMVDLGADVVVAFLVKGARNAGTRDCMRRATAAGLEPREVWA